jgi:hypothetical protein
MATKPDLIKWVSNDDTLKILDPGTTKKANGFIYQEKPAFQYINYLFNRLSKWLRGLQGAYAQVVVGSASQVTDYIATHTIVQLNDTVVAQGSKVLFLEGTHALTGNLTLTNSDLTFEMENGAAIIDLATFKLSLSGANVDAKLRVTNPNGASDSVSIGGTNSKVSVSGLSITQLTVGATGFGVALGTISGAKLNNGIVLLNNNEAFKGTRYGNIWSHNAGDVINDWDISAGGCMDSTGAYLIATAALTKRADAAWAVGTNAGMLDTGAVGNSDYYIWAIARSDTGVTDYLSSLSSTAPTMPANYDYKRLIGWFRRIAGVNTLMDVNETEGGGVDVTWIASVLDLTDNNPDLSEILATLSVPVGFSVIANIQGILTNAAGVIAPNARFYDPAQNDETPSATLMDLPNVSTGAGFARTHASRLNIRTNTSAQVGYKISNASSADITLYIRTLGFRWARRN